ncbi:uncharacterized protein LOC116340428 [Contarinia nasturtii]|uniref:uncharacterized protein LOC116340428 n=1 Tax=Contarinia nasturtii TaxID=265458 RepID=UPI0012D3EA3B|nr:uncharacterized protein LOC116340428 [Contarinia nasturtii]
MSGNANLVGDITLNISRARISSTKCCFRSCSTECPDELHRIPRAIRYEIMKNKRFFIPEKSVACNFHSDYSVLSEINIPVENCAFTAAQIEEMVDLLRSDPKQLKDEGQVLNKNSDAGVKADTGLTREQFQNLFHCLNSLRDCLKNDKIASDYLYTYLMKLRTGRTDEDIGRVFKITRWAVGKRLKCVREAMESDFVYQNVNCLLSREELAKYTTFLSQMLFCHGDINRPVLILDGTYVYIQKSTNYEVQKQSYSNQKKRNFVRIMNCVTTDGTILFVLGPYPASSNDAKVLQSIIQSTNALDNLNADDVLLLDRGFRDCVNLLKEKGFDVQMPALLQRSSNKKQLTTSEANRSRFVTANRYGVETRNGHIKTIFKLFQHEWNPIAMPHLMTDYRICAALINAYCKSIESNKGMATEIGRRMLDRYETPNELSNIVSKNEFQYNLSKFNQFYDFEQLPALTQTDLILIALGKYQIKQAASYCQEHFKSNNFQFAVFECPNNILRKFFANFTTGDKQLKLLMARIKSRFRSNKTHDAYILIDILGQGESVVLAYCCSCYNGLRTVGCCSHVMTIIWFALHIKKPSKMHRPAAFLDNYFGEASSSDCDSSDAEE